MEYGPNNKQRALSDDKIPQNVLNNLAICKEDNVVTFLGTLDKYLAPYCNVEAYVKEAEWASIHLPLISCLELNEPLMLSSNVEKKFFPMANEITWDKPCQADFWVMSPLPNNLLEIFKSNKSSLTDYKAFSVPKYIPVLCIERKPFSSTDYSGKVPKFKAIDQVTAQAYISLKWLIELTKKPSYTIYAIALTGPLITVMRFEQKKRENMEDKLDRVCIHELEINELYSKEKDFGKRSQKIRELCAVIKFIGTKTIDIYNDLNPNAKINSTTTSNLQ